MEEVLYREMHELEMAHWWFRAKRRIVLELINRYLDVSGRPRFLDLGCGTGAMLAELEGLGEAVGMDVSDDALSFAAEHTGAMLIRGEIPRDLDELEGDFDCVLMLDLLEHVDDDGDVLRAAPRLLSPGGILVVTVPAYQWLYAPRDAYHHHRRRYSRKALKGLLDGSGLRPELLSYYNFFLFPFAAAGRLVSRARREEPGPDLRLPSPFVNEVLERVFAAERFFLPRTSFPCGLSLVAVLRGGRLERRPGGRVATQRPNNYI